MSSIILKILLGFAGPLLLMILKQIGGSDVFAKAIDLAKDEVLRLDGEDLDEFEKRKQATLALRESAGKLGLGIRDSVLDMALSFALGGLRTGVLK